MSNTRDLIIELGTEELPAIGLEALARAFDVNIRAGLEKLELGFSDTRYYVTPRRLAVLIRDLVEQQDDRVEVRRGPALDKAYDDEGNPTKAALGFADSCNVDVKQLETIDNGKGKWLGITRTIQGKPTTALLDGLVRDALAGLPVRKRMRWSDHEFDFVRPVHWLLVVFGSEAVDMEIMGLQSGNVSYGHRFMTDKPITVDKADDYELRLRNDGKILADFEIRRDEISKQIHALADGLNGRIVENEDLLEEVTGLVEWPVALTGNFDDTFLELPREVLIATMEKHQKSFAIQDNEGQLLAHFISISNLESKQPAQVIKGNEKVLQPRLSDAAFFWKRDLQNPLAEQGKRLAGVLYQETLGSMAERTDRIGALAGYLAGQLDFDCETAVRAGTLCKCDLVTDMVGEFPDLQGIMGKYYALKGGEDSEVATAIEEHYLPRFAGDQLPQTRTGQVLAIADKLDTLVGIFSIGKVPTGDRDPFGLRRAALGVLRILIEQQLDLDLTTCLKESACLYRHEFDQEKTVSATFEYIMDRLRKYYQDRDIATHIYDSVFAKRPVRPLDFDQRIAAVVEFNKLPEAVNLSAANKRISNILKQADINHSDSINKKLLTESAEIKLFDEASSLRQRVSQLVRGSEYREALMLLAGLQTSIDDFFDNVLVMDKNNAVRDNRIALLKSVSEMFLEIADISRLSVSK